MFVDQQIQRCDSMIRMGHLSKALTVLLLLTIGALPAIAQVLIDPFGARRVVAVAAQTDDEAEERFPGGAPLKTDPELERRLIRAEKFAKDGRYDLATILWQNVLEESADTLMTRDQRIYTSLAEEVERTIAKLPPNGLRIYRITADGEARGLLAAGKGDKEREEEALASVSRKYFLSSFGDDAAYELGCLALDRFDFVGASRLFSKILEKHPDPSMPRTELWMRLAVAAAHVGDRESASQALKNLEQEVGRKPDKAVLAVVKKNIEQAGDGAVDIAAAAGDWNMRLGGPSRRGHMKKLPEEVTRATLTRMWNFHFPMNFSTSASNGAQAIRFRSKKVEPLQVAKSDDGLVNRWKSGNWNPAGQLLVSDGKIFLKTNNDLTCWDAAAETDQPIWRTAWLNAFTLDTKSQMIGQMYRNMGNRVPGGKQPVAAAEVMLFGDRVHQSMSISNGVVYNIEGRRVPRHGGGIATSATSTPTPFRYGVTPRRTRVNWLAAYDLKTGKAKWYRSPMDSTKSESNDLGFMNAPVPYGNFLLVPVTDSGTMWLYALNRHDGSTVWKSYLCDEPAGGCEAWSPIGVSIDGRDAYVVCGAGVVFAVDAVSGDIRFAVRYSRDGKSNQMMRNFGYQGSQMKDLEGWRDDIAIPFGRQLVVMASDHDGLFAVDRRTGEEMWRTPRTPNDHPGEYCLGVTGTSLFVGGQNCLRRYDLDKDGKLIWEKVFEEKSLGCGVLTEDAIYMPVKDSIVRYDLNGKITSQVGVHLNAKEDPDPVGNLFSDGSKLWVVSANNVYALTNRDQHLAVLGERIAKGNPAAYLERMELFAKDGKLGEAIDDLLGAYDLIVKSESSEVAMASLLEGMTTINLPTVRPQATLEIIGDRCVDRQADLPSKVSSKELLSHLNTILYATLRKIHKEAPKGYGAAILKIAPLLTREHQLSLARQAMLATVTSEDGQILRAAAASRFASEQIVAAESLAKVLEGNSKGLLNQMLAVDNDQVRFAAARGLASLGDQDSLSAFVKLLESENPRVRLHSLHVLRKITNKEFQFSAYSDAPTRAKQIKDWQDWVKSDGATAKLVLPLPDTEPFLGRTLMSFYGRGRVIALGSDGKELWNRNVPRAYAVHGLPNGNYLVSLYSNHAVVEYDQNGKEVWRKDGLPGNPFSVERLPNGNTLVACSNSQKVLEIRPDKSIAWEQTVTNNPMHARRLDNGNTLVSLSGNHRVVEIDRLGNVKWEVTNMQGAVSAQRLENGNTLVVLMNASKVVEVNREGTIVWEVTGLTQPRDAQRLPDGKTLIAEHNGVLEVDANKNKRFLKQEQSASGVSRF